MSRDLRDALDVLEKREKTSVRIHCWRQLSSH